MSRITDGMINVYIEGEVYGRKFYQNVHIASEVWDEMNKFERENLTRELILKNIKTTYKILEE